MAPEEKLFAVLSKFMKNQTYLGVSSLEQAWEQIRWQDVTLQTAGLGAHLETLIDQLQKIQKMLIADITSSVENAKSISSKLPTEVITIKSEEDESSAECKRKGFSVSEAVIECPDLDPDLVQVRADKQEIERRIQAFLDRKKIDINEENRREFRNTIHQTEDDDSCARTDAVFIPRPGSCSHVPVTRVVNAHGPQTRPPATSSPRKPGPVAVSVKLEPGTLTSGAQERLSNMERHLRTKAGNSKDVFYKLQHLEDRILYLESLSPEYFSYTPPVKLRKHRQPVFDKGPKAYDNMEGLTLREIEDRMVSLKTRLRNSNVFIKEESMDT